MYTLECIIGANIIYFLNKLFDTPRPRTGRYSGKNPATHMFYMKLDLFVLSNFKKLFETPR